MAAGVSRKISAASARSHTRRPKQSTPFQLPSGLFKKILVAFVMGLLAWAFQAIKPPPPRICGSADAPPVTAPRIKLSDGRHLAYKEHGVPKDDAKHKIIYVHGLGSWRHDAVIYTLSPDTVEGLGVYIVSIDRPGYGESDPNPKRTLKSMATDIEELADQLQLGSKFYVVGFSMGGQWLWTCLKYIPHRLAGATLIAPAINFWWSGFPANLSEEAYYQQLPRDQWAYRIAHYTPWLTYWWNTQTWFPSCAILAQSPDVLSRQDLELGPRIITGRAHESQSQAQAIQQGGFESLHRDLIVGLGAWEFNPLNLDNPFPNNEGSVHLWQGDEDRLVPFTLQRYIAQQLPWIKYHELSGSGHMFPYKEGMADAIVKALLLGENSEPQI